MTPCLSSLRVLTRKCIFIFLFKNLFLYDKKKKKKNIPNVLNISNNVIVFGTTQAEHDYTLRAVFQHFSDKGLTLNGAKCKFNQDQLTCFGFVVSGDGISPDPLTVDAIKKCASTLNCKGCSQFCWLRDVLL